MAYLTTVPLLLAVLTMSVPYCVFGQSETVADNIFDSLDALGCRTFKSIILAANLESVYRSPQPLTLFVFNDTAVDNKPPNAQLEVLQYTENENLNEAEEYVNSFTIDEAIDDTSFSPDKPYRTASNEMRTLFLNRKQLRFGDVASGVPGPTKSFCNGAMVIRPNIRAGQHIIHIVDRVLDLQWPKTVMSYVHSRNPSNVRYKFHEDLMRTLQASEEKDSIDNYRMQVQRILQGDQVTFFLPTDEAMSLIPNQVLSKLRGDPARLLDIITLHIIPNQILYTSLVNHNEGFRSQRDSGRITFRKNYNKEAVYITGALRNGHPVTAKLNPANVTVLNGVVHHIDGVLGLVYRSAYQEIYFDSNLNTFQQVVSTSRVDLQNVLKNQQVIIFAPISSAVLALANVQQNYINNQSLVDMIMQYSMLQQDERISLTEYQGGYESLIAARSRYMGRLIKIYSQGNDTWVEGGYVRARVIKPDIGVTNGVVHQIDAVFGIPTRDIPQTIFCEDRLEKMYIQLKNTGLVDYLHDPKLVKNQGCTFRASGRDDFITTGDMVRRPDFRNVCGGGGFRCEFTFFVPNDTALASFISSQGSALDVIDDISRWRWILSRLITFREKIYLDRIAPGAPYTYIADTGELVYIQTDSRSNIASGRRTAFIMFRGVRADIIHSDIGATNGVIHIINNIIFVPEDIYRRGGGNTTHVSLLTLFLALILLVVSDLSR